MAGSSGSHDRVQGIVSGTTEGIFPASEELDVRGVCPT